MSERAALPPDLASLCALFGARLHAAGLPVTPESSARFARAVATAEPLTVADLYWCARVTLVSGVEQLDRFDALFAAVFGGTADVADHRGEGATQRTTRAPQAPAPRATDPAGTPPPSEGAAAVGTTSTVGGDSGPTVAVRAVASAEERLANTDFAALTAEELAALEPFLRAIALDLPRRASRRRFRHPGGDRLDVRATLRRSHRTGGDPVVAIRRRRRRRPRRLVALLDISGSMEAYARAYLQVLWGAATGARAETFVFATRLTRLTRALQTSNPSVALARAGALAPDWSGGTRIGLALKAFLDRYGRRGMARGAIVLVVSDGWERDDPALLGAQMAALARLAHRVVWVNPRVAAAGFEPRTGGMAAALPHVDLLVSGHTAAALAEVFGGLDAAPDWVGAPGRGTVGG